MERFKYDIPGFKVGGYSFGESHGETEAPSREAAVAKIVAAKIGGYFDKALVRHYTHIALGSFEGGIERYATPIVQERPKAVERKREDDSKLERQVNVTNVFERFIRSAVASVGNDPQTDASYDVKTDYSKQADGRRTLYKMSANLNRQGKTVLRYEDGSSRVHDNDVDGRLDIDSERAEFTQEIAQSLEQRGLRVVKRDLELELFKGA